MITRALNNNFPRTFQQGEFQSTGGENIVLIGVSSGLEFSLLTLSRLIIIVSIFQYLAHGGYLRSQILRGVLVNPPGYSISPSKSCILQLPSFGYSIDYN